MQVLCDACRNQLIVEVPLLIRDQPTGHGLVPPGCIDYQPVSVQQAAHITEGREGKDQYVGCAEIIECRHRFSIKHDFQIRYRIEVIQRELLRINSRWLSKIEIEPLNSWMKSIGPHRHLGMYPHRERHT